MRFLVDAQLPKAICASLAKDEVLVLHVKDVQGAAASDTAIWRYALANELVIVSKDEDFALRLNSGVAGPRLVWIRLGNCTNNALRVTLATVWPEVCAALAAGESIVEIR